MALEVEDEKESVCFGMYTFLYTILQRFHNSADEALWSAAPNQLVIIYSVSAEIAVSILGI